MEAQMPDPVPSIMRWRFKQLKKLLKETVTMTPNNGQATVKPGQRIIIDTKKGKKKKRAEAEKITKSDDLKKIEDLYNKMKSEKKRIKDLLK